MTDVLMVLSTTADRLAELDRKTRPMREIQLATLRAKEELMPTLTKEDWDYWALPSNRKGGRND